MITCPAVPSIGYYLAGREGTPLGYYADDDNGGVWWTSWSDSPEAQAAFSDVIDGAPINKEVFIRLCGGHLADGRSVDRAGGVRRPAYDLHFAAPKPVSLLALLSAPEIGRRIQAKHDRAVRRTLKFIAARGLIETRTGRGGHQREAARALVAAIFRHITSRANDPQLHSHCPMPNTALRGDGSIGAIDNKKLLDFQRLAGAMYSAELAAGMRELGFQVEADGKSFKITGLSDELCDLFSKRRLTIEAVAKTKGFDPSLDRERAQLANLETRPTKVPELPVDVLRAEWLSEMRAAGFDLDDLPVPQPGNAPAVLDLAGLVEEAIALAFNNNSVLPEPKLMAIVAEHLQWRCNADQVERAVTEILPRMVTNVTPDERRPTHTMFSTPQIISEERDIQADAEAGKALRAFVSTSHVEAAIAARPSLSDEQKIAVRHALNTDQFSIFEGAAGAGKSFAAGAVAEAAQAAGLKVYALGPSWSAANVLAKDTNTARAQTRALAGFLNDVESGKLELGAHAMILLDEGGLADRSLTARLTSVVRVSGCKVVITGDTRQLQPVGAGAPLRLLTRVLGSSRINEVRRQKHAWARAASMRLGRGRTDEALRDYDFRRHVSWRDSAAATIQSLADRFVADRLHDQAWSINGTLPTSLVIASWNEDVLELNRQIRDRLQTLGEIGTSEIEVAILARGKLNKPTASKIRLAAGERIIFGETIDLATRLIRNADVAKVLAVGAGANPTITLQFEEDGQKVSAAVRDLVGYRADGEPKLPLLRHGYCVTTNFAQGMTVDRAYVAALRPMPAEAIYVAMTRHRDAAQLFVDTSRFSFAKLGMKAGSVAFDARKKAFYAECQRPTQKLNVTDLNPRLTAPLSDQMAAKGSVKAETLLHMEQRGRQKLGDAARLDEPVTLSGMPNALFRQVERPREPDTHARSRPKSWDPLARWIFSLREKIATVLLNALKSRAPPLPGGRYKPRFTLLRSSTLRAEASAVPNANDPSDDCVPAHYPNEGNAP